MAWDARAWREEVEVLGGEFMYVFFVFHCLPFWELLMLGTSAYHFQRLSRSSCLWKVPYS